MDRKVYIATIKDKTKDISGWFHAGNISALQRIIEETAETAASLCLPRTGLLVWENDNVVIEVKEIHPDELTSSNLQSFTGEDWARLTAERNTKGFTRYVRIKIYLHASDDGCYDPEWLETSDEELLEMVESEINDQGFSAWISDFACINPETEVIWEEL